MKRALLLIVLSTALLTLGFAQTPTLAATRVPPVRPLRAPLRPPPPLTHPRRLPFRLPWKLLLHLRRRLVRPRILLFRPQRRFPCRQKLSSACCRDCCSTRCDG